MNRYGAVNFISGTIGLVQQSLFTTNQNMSSHNPKIPLNILSWPFYVNDNGWFFKFPTGNSFNCSTNWTCATFIVGDGEDEYRTMVVNDSTVSSVFIPESKVMAQQLIYKELIEDSVLLNSEVNYQIFASEKQDEAIGKLYAANRQLNKVGISDSLLLSTISTAHQIISSASDSIKYIDSLLQFNSTTNLFIQKENLMGIIVSQREILNALGNQIKSNSLNILSIAASDNNASAPTQLPDANEKFMNEMTIGYKNFGLPFLINNYESILQIAIQCPYSGGPAVNTARVFVYLLNDNMEYDDDAICGAMGIFRLQNLQSVKNEMALKIIPNPSSGIVQLIFDGLSETTLNIEIFDVIGKLVFNKDTQASSNTIQLNLSHLINGFYYVKLTDQDGIYLTEKIMLNK